ncbi:DUF5958 family protein [Spirosoma radiotolerans]|uniref:Uncharacterized protein n=1 Tax=Spirosoma radiotolerans TaxID=1379870 RepID=A0A0E3V767_9BACT|nr:DUF5958 family protein [Spirosoma radiotolerans]AKD55637.1 hypothetical protein SD10_12745 [Spirosoma radiotolerans]
MSLEEEIAINQFGQGALSEADMLNAFAQLDAPQQRKRFIQLYLHVASQKLAASDVDQALSNCSLTTEDPVNKYLNLAYFKVGSKGIIYTPYTEEPPEGDLVKPYKVLLYVFKANYQRRYAVEKDNSTMWWYQDFSKSKTAQDLLDTHRRLAEEIYANASFRTEFMTMAKLWHTYYDMMQTLRQEPPAEPKTRFDFIRYDQIEHDPTWTAANDRMRACALLRSSVEKALFKQYGQDIDEIRRLTLDVINRHMHETYSSGIDEYIGY